MTTGPLVEAIVRLLTRHHNGCDHHVQPAPWMRNAATEIVDAMHYISWRMWMADGFDKSPAITIDELAPELDRRNQP